MAQRWTFEEDFIICKFSYEYAHISVLDEDLDFLILELKEHGYDSRGIGAVKKRVRDYQNLFVGYDVPRVAEQVKSIYKAYLDRKENPKRIEEIQRYINQTYVPEDANDLWDESGSFAYQLTNMHRYVGIGPVAPSFKEQLLEYIKKSGMTDAEVYNASFVSRDKFNHIINGRKGKKVKTDGIGKNVNASPKTVMKLCIGLKLTYEEAVHLMACAGYAFRPNEEVDMVVVACLKQRICNIVQVNIELYEHNLELFDIKDNKKQAAS